MAEKDQETVESLHDLIGDVDKYSEVAPEERETVKEKLRNLEEMLSKDDIPMLSKDDIPRLHEILACLGEYESLFQTVLRVVNKLIDSRKPSAVTTRRIGEDVGTGTGLFFHVHGVERRSKLSPGGGVYSEAASGKVWLVAEIEIMNYMLKDYEYHIMHVVARDKDGNVYLSARSVMALQNFIVFYPKEMIRARFLPVSMTLKPGDKARGYLPIEVPQDATGFILEYNDIVGDAVLAIDLAV